MIDSLVQEKNLPPFGSSWSLCSVWTVHSSLSISAQGRGLSVLTCQRTDAAAGVSQAAAADDLLERLPHLLTPKGIDERVDHRVAHDEDEVHVEVGHEAHAVEVPWAGDHQNQVEEERGPADNEDAQQDGEGDGPLHAGPLVDGVVAGQSGDALDVRASQHEHVAVEGGHDEKHGEEHGDQADDDGSGVGVDDEDDAAARAEGPDYADDAAGSLHRHDIVVSQCVEYGNVPADNITDTFMTVIEYTTYNWGIWIIIQPARISAAHFLSCSPQLILLSTPIRLHLFEWQTTKISSDSAKNIW